MATLREIRGRIVGVKKTQKITKAMKMVAAAKLRRAQTGVVSARPYARAMGALLEQLAGGSDLAQHPLVAEREVRSVAIVVVTSDRGLCGAFNSNLIKAVIARAAAQYPGFHEQGRLRLFCIGKKGADVFTKRQYRVAGKYTGLSGSLVFGQAQAICREVVDTYRKGEVDRVDIIFNEFKSIASQKIVVEQFLPVPAAPGQKAQQVDYIYEPSREAIVNALLPRHLDFQVWRMLLESNASEQGARMTAMENATENANEMISTLQLSYNKARQASITKELLEVVGGAEALRKSG
jgi:F-type H+-transporting ATPase subunit gamma